ncbi:MAG: hypothetical protein QXW97_01705 [Candidatus Pacearchaeota archaeon]
MHIKKLKIMIKFWRKGALKKVSELEQKFISNGERVQIFLIDFSRNLYLYETPHLRRILYMFLEMRDETREDEKQYKDLFLFKGGYNPDLEKLKQRLNDIINFLDYVTEKRIYG